MSNEKNYDDRAGCGHGGYDRNGFNSAGFNRLGYNRLGYDLARLEHAIDNTSRIAAGLCAGIDYQSGRIINEDEIAEDAIAIYNAIVVKMHPTSTK